MLTATLLGLLACTGEKDDIDGDGIAAPLDCDDNDPAVFPGAVEVCDGLDNDCDSQTDELLVTDYWPDVDGDGYGDGTQAAEALCEAPTGSVTNDDDCDDGRADVNPTAYEDCDEGVDLNCDGDPTAGATDTATWYRDGDKDGFGNDLVPQVSCTQPSGYVAQGGDCDDLRNTVNPLAPETCNDLDDDCDTVVDDEPTDGTTLYADADGDSYGDTGSAQLRCEGDGVADDTDCDDTKAAVHPGANEVCDGGVDNDCDPATDEDTVDGDLYYADGDGDGFGNAQVRACTQPAGTVGIAGDCDDGDALVYPGADEYCNNDDDDCDTNVDEFAVDGTPYHPDLDFDGYGDSYTVVVACSQPPDWTTDNQDCDDTDEFVNPDAEELCNGGVDDDCDSFTVDDDAPTAPTWYADSDGDGHGNAGAPVQTCLVPAGYSALSDDCNDGNAAIYPGAPETCNGLDDDCDPSTDEDDTVANYRDQDLDGYGFDGDVVYGCTPPPGYVPVGGDCDDTDPTITPVTAPGCIVNHCGVIALSTTWRNNVTHKVTCDVLVEGAAKPTLTIEDGVVVAFTANTELAIARNGEGKLVVDGTTTGVQFVADDPFPQPGDWKGLWIGRNDRGSTLTRLLVQHAGSNGLGGIVIEGGDPELDRVVAQQNLYSGIFVLLSEPLIHDSQILDNTDDGLYVAEAAGLARTDLAGTAGPSLERNTITGNLGRPITIPGSYADEIEPSNVLSPNDAEEIGLLSGVLKFDGTWYDHGIPYVVEFDKNIEVEDSPISALHIEDGVEVYFSIGAEMHIGDGAAGKMDIIDGPQGVLFSGTADVINLSTNWDGIFFGASDTGSVIRNLTIEYGGASGGNLFVIGSAPQFDNVISQRSDSNGMYVTGGTAAPEIQNSSFLDNDQNGIYVEAGSGIARSVFGPTFVNNLLTGNGESPVVMPPNFLGELDPSTEFSGNGMRIRVHGGTVLEDATWRKLDEDYQILADVSIGGPQDPVVDVEDLVVMWFDRNAGLTAGVIDDGGLVIDVATDVRMTSSDAAPGEGDWDGVMLGHNGPLKTQPRLRNVSIEYAGGSNPGDEGGSVVVIDNSSGTDPLIVLDELTLYASSKVGVLVYATARVSIDDSYCADPLGNGCWDIRPGAQLASFTNNVCVGAVVTGSFPLDDIDMLDATSTYSGPVLIKDTSLVESVTMPLIPAAYWFQYLLAVGDAGNPILTVAPGNTLLFSGGAGIEVGVNADGGIVVNPPGGVTFTSAFLPPQAGDWEGVRLGLNCSTIEIHNAALTYAGGNNKANLWVDGCVGVAGSNVDTVTLTNSSSCGLEYDIVANPMLVPVTNVTYANNVGGNQCP